MLFYFGTPMGLPYNYFFISVNHSLALNFGEQGLCCLPFGTKGAPGIILFTMCLCIVLHYFQVEKYNLIC